MLSQRKTLALTLLPVPLVYLADQGLKAQAGSLGLPWHQHYVERPVSLALVLLLAALVISLFCRSRLIALGAGMITGGALGNLNDIAKQGFAWNMFPAPAPNLYFNLADFFLLVGALLCLWGLVLIVAEFKGASPLPPGP